MLSVYLRGEIDNRREAIREMRRKKTDKTNYGAKKMNVIINVDPSYK